MAAGGAGRACESREGRRGAAGRAGGRLRLCWRSAAPEGHRVRGPREAPGGGSWRLHPGSARPSAGTGGARPRSDWIYHPCPAPPTPLAARPRQVPSCRALPLRERALLGGGWGGRAASPECGASASSCSLLLALASLPRDVREVRPQGDAPPSCSCSLMEKVCAQLRNPGRLLSRKKESFLISSPPPPIPREPEIHLLF